MSLDTLITINVSLSAATPTSPSFGAALVAGYHTLGGSKRVLGPYANVAQMVTAGFTANSPICFAAAKFFAQNPTPTALYVGRRALPFTQKFKFTPTSTTNGDIYNINFGAVQGVGGTTATYTVTGSPTLSTVCTALATAIGTAIGSGTATGASGTFVEWTAGSAGVLVECNNLSPTICQFLEDTADPGIATDLTAIYAQDQSDWYGLILDSNSKNEVLAAAAWVESNKKLFPVASSDSEIADAASTTDVAYLVQADSYTRTGVLFLQNSNMSYAGAAWMGKMLPTVPGEDTWAYKQLAAVTVDSLPPGWDTAVFAKNASVYTKLAGVPQTQKAITGSGEYIDITVFVDWLKATMQIAILTLFINSPKVPFDDLGIEQILTVMRGVLQQGEDQDGLVPGSWSASAPSAKNVSAVDKGNRNLPNVTFTGELAGAIHSLVINGTLTN